MSSSNSSKFAELDYFSEKFNLQFNKRSQYQTSLGAFLTIVLVCSGITLIITQGMEFIYKQQPIAAIVTKFDLNTSLLYINRSSLLLSFAVVDKNFITMNDPTLFSFTARQFINNQSAANPFPSIPVTLHNCSEAYEDFEVLNLTRYYEKNRMSTAFCLSNGTKIIGGEFNTDYFSNLWIEVRLCTNTTDGSGPICKPKKVIEDTFRGAYFEFYYIDTLYVADSFDFPLKKIMKNYFIKLDPGIEKMTEMYFQKIRVLSDGGAFIFENWIEKEDFTYDFIREEYQMMQPTGDRVMAFTINSSYNNIEIKRRYLDLVSFAGDMGGIINLLVFIFGNINLHVIKYKMLEDIFNSLYDFRLDDEPTLKTDSDDNIIEKFNNLIEERPNYHNSSGVSLKFDKPISDEKDLNNLNDLNIYQELVTFPPKEINSKSNVMEKKVKLKSSPDIIRFKESLFLSTPSKNIKKSNNKEIAKISKYKSQEKDKEKAELSSSSLLKGVNNAQIQDQSNDQLSNFSNLILNTNKPSTNSINKNNNKMTNFESEKKVEDSDIYNSPRKMLSILEKDIPKLSRASSNSSSPERNDTVKIEHLKEEDVKVIKNNNEIKEIKPSTLKVEYVPIDSVPNIKGIVQNESDVSSNSGSNKESVIILSGGDESSESSINALPNYKNSLFKNDTNFQSIKKEPTEKIQSFKKEPTELYSSFRKNLNAVNIFLKSDKNNDQNMEPERPGRSGRKTRFANNNNYLKDFEPNPVRTKKKNSSKLKVNEDYENYQDDNININTDRNLLKTIGGTNKTKPEVRERDYLISKLENFRKQEKKVLKISYMDIIGITCLRCCFSKYQKKYDIIHKTEVESCKYLDYIDIIKLLQEFTKFKVFFMSISQIKLFSFISKPKIRDTNTKEEEQNIKNDLIHGKLFDSNQNLHDLYNHYLILKRFNKNKDQKLFNLIDDDIIYCFEKMRKLNI